MTTAASIRGTDAPITMVNMSATTTAPISIQKNSTVRNGTSARSSILAMRFQIASWPNNFSVSLKTFPIIASRFSLRAAFEVTRVSPTCTEIRLRTQDPRMPAKVKSVASRTRKATTAAMPSGPVGPYAPFGTIFDGAASVGGVPGTVNASVAVPWPTTAAST